VEKDDVLLAEQLLEALSSLRRQVRGTAGRPWPDAPLTGAQVDLVRLVRRQPGIPVGAAAEALRLAPNTVSTLVRQLAAAGVLRREPDAADRRIGRLDLTPASRRRLEGWRDQRSELTARALARLDDGDRRALAAAVPAVGRLVAALAHPEEDA
jgi:DNA-binding MarR family transcriptional regulator